MYHVPYYIVQWVLAWYVTWFPHEVVVLFSCWIGRL